MFITVYLVCTIMLEYETSQLNCVFNALEICLAFQDIFNKKSQTTHKCRKDI